MIHFTHCTHQTWHKEVLAGLDLVQSTPGKQSDAIHG